MQTVIVRGVEIGKTSPCAEGRRYRKSPLPVVEGGTVGSEGWDWRSGGQASDRSAAERLSFVVRGAGSALELPSHDGIAHGGL